MEKSEEISQKSLQVISNRLTWLEREDEVCDTEAKKLANIGIQYTDFELAFYDSV